MILLYPKNVNEVYYYFNMAEDEEAFHQVELRMSKTHLGVHPPLFSALCPILVVTS